LLFEFYPEIKLLLIDESDQKVTMHYMEDSWKMPKIGQRPPFYTNPKYEAAYPII